ncbi:hypothetical protein, partial [Nonomuraea harbinensis]
VAPAAAAASARPATRLPERIRLAMFMGDGFRSWFIDLEAGSETPRDSREHTLAAKQDYLATQQYRFKKTPF